MKWFVVFGLAGLIGGAAVPLGWAAEPSCSFYKVNSSLLNISKEAGGGAFIDVLEEGETVCVTRQQKTGGREWGYISYKLQKPDGQTPVKGWTTLRYMKKLSAADAKAAAAGAGKTTAPAAPSPIAATPPAAAAKIAAASKCTTGNYTHDSSLVEAKSCKGKLTIKYAQPRQELVQRGARKGSMMFTGTEQAGGAISGHALTFDSRCKSVAFAVTGSRQGGSIILQGNVPVREGSCQISRHEAYKMVFSPQASKPVVNAGAKSAAAVVTPSCPAGYAFSQGQCLRAGAPASRGNSGVAAYSVAAADSAPAAGSTALQGADPGALTISIQQELGRLGCNPGTADGDWGRRTRNAMKAFNKYASLNLDTAKPSEAALPALQSKTGTICPAPATRSKKVAARKKIAQPAKRKSPAGPAKKKGLWGGESTRIECEQAVNADCF